MRIRQVMAGLLALGWLGACVPGQAPFAGTDLSGLPAMPWDARPEAATWTAAGLMAVRSRDTDLAGQVPADADALCPGYASGSMADRRAFWVAMVALTADKESRFNPGIVASGRYVGLMQISPRTARAAGCGVTSVEDLKDGENNLFCAVQILAGHVARDGVAVGPKGNQGLGRDWTPWRAAEMRAQAADWLTDQAYCR